jgi:hypothetical protein
MNTPTSKQETRRREMVINSQGVRPNFRPAGVIQTPDAADEQQACHALGLEKYLLSE